MTERFNIDIVRHSSTDCRVIIRNSTDLIVQRIVCRDSDISNLFKKEFRKFLKDCNFAYC